MAENSTKKTAQSHNRSTAIRHAINIEEKKRLKARVADLVLEAYDLPSSTDADPARPIASDVTLFRHCLSLFQPSDLDDLVKERNIDDRCGYALCPNRNQKVSGGGEKIWNQKGGKEFKILDRAELERWCSRACGNRTAFVRAQLGSEPSWLRETQNEVQLLDEVGRVDDVLSAARALAGGGPDKEVVERLQALSLERGDEVMQDVSDQVAIVEKSTKRVKTKPPTRSNDVVEGYQPRRVRFAQEPTADSSNA